LKPVRVRDARLVVYTASHWRLLAAKRRKALAIVNALNASGLDPLVIGSIARGDVHEGSDIDIAILDPVPTFRVEIALETAGFNIVRKEVVQATPRHTPKAYLYLDLETSIHVPLAPLSRLEQEFYRFGGAIGRKDLEAGRRVPGVNKRLLVIVPTEEGHIEYSVLGREREVAQLLGVSLDIVKERVTVLSKRDEVGRTGVFFKLVLPPSANIEEAVVRCARTVPALRKKIEGWLL